ncbi:MAG: serine-type D-Ala-D-Ala carboxypeptidase D-alanyl-D-alanine carboxypeptidase [Candidatus Adlerbacteria bacterium]|nr:serine-type D-Ala-D-Ala carboxypeptidase D-alanyl-D-alanine carboxypeptidase [Candidatus Adlerbacteria bacterium]
MRYKPSSPINAIILSIAGVSAAFAAGIFAVTVYRPAQNSQVAAVAETIIVPEVYPKPIQLDPATLVAKAALVYDPTTGTILFEKDARNALPLASLTKLMTIETVLAHVATNTVVTITADDLAPDGDWGLMVGDKARLSDLIRLGIIASSNDAMEAVANTLGMNSITEMNATARKLGLTSSHFSNPTGLDESATVAGAYGSAYDVALLAHQVYSDHPEYFDLTQQSTVSIPVSGRTVTSKATATPLLSIPGLVGAKTGYTDLAGGNLVAIFDLDIAHPLVLVVLGSTEEGRFSDIRTLISATRNSQ